MINILSNYMVFIGVLLFNVFLYLCLPIVDSQSSGGNNKARLVFDHRIKAVTIDSFNSIRITELFLKLTNERD